MVWKYVVISKCSPDRVKKKSSLLKNNFWFTSNFVLEGKLPIPSSARLISPDWYPIIPVHGYIIKAETCLVVMNLVQHIMLTCTYSVALTLYFRSQLTDTTVVKQLNAYIYNHCYLCSICIPYSYLKPRRRRLCWRGLWWGRSRVLLHALHQSSLPKLFGIVFQSVSWAPFSPSKNWYIVFMHVLKEFDHLFDISEPFHLLLFNNGLQSKRKNVYGRLLNYTVDCVSPT